MATQTIDHNTLARLIDAGTDCGARIVGQSGGCGAPSGVRSRSIRKNSSSTAITGW